MALTTDRDDSVGPLLGADQATFAQIVTIARLQVADWPGSIIELSGDGLDGWYLADEVRIEDSHFSGLADGLARFGREGRDESTFGPRFSLTGSRLEAVAEGGVALALNGIDQLHVTDNRIVASGSFEIRRRVLGWPFEIGTNDVDETVSLTLRGVDGEPVDATLAGGAQ